MTHLMILKTKRLRDEKVQAALGGKDPVKTIVVPGRTVNLVVGK